MSQPTENPSITNSAVTLPAYWVFQFSGWFAFAGLSYFSLTIWYNPGELNPALHTLLQSLLGIVVSHPLRWVARRSWDADTARRVFVNGTAVFAASIAWTALRLLTFTWMTGEAIPVEDWGGWTFASVTVFASWAFCYHALKYYRQWIDARELSIKSQNAMLEAKAFAQQEKIKRMHAENLARESRLRMLNYQLNPHFFFNALNSVSALVRMNDKDAATEMLARIGDFLRTSLEGDEDLQHPLCDEVGIINAYLDIEKIRFNDRLYTDFQISDEALSVTIPSLLLQPIFENCIKHAVGGSLSPTTIAMKASLSEGRLRINIADTGPGMREDTSSAARMSSGVGLKNVEERLRSVYGSDFSMDISDNSPSGFAIDLDLPLSIQHETLRAPVNA